MQRILIAFVRSFAFVTPLTAARVTITPTITAILDKTFNPVPDGGLPLFPDPADYYQIQVNVNVKTTGLDGSAVGFSNTAFNSSARPGEGIRRRWFKWSMGAKRIRSS